MDPLMISLLASALATLIGGVGAGIGASKKKEGSFLGGEPGHNEQYALLTPEQQGLQKSAIQQALQQLQSLNQPGANTQGFQPIEEYAREKFKTDTVPSLAERFTSMGGGQRSSAFQSALGQAGTGLESQLAALRAQYGQQQQALDTSRLSALLGGALGKGFENTYFPNRPGFLESIGNSVASSAPSFVHQYAQQDQNQKLTDILNKLSSR